MRFRVFSTFRHILVVCCPVCGLWTLAGADGKWGCRKGCASATFVKRHKWDGSLAAYILGGSR